MNDSSAVDDFDKVRNGNMSFKTFADKWMPYAELLGSRAKETTDLMEQNILDEFIGFGHIV